MGETIQEVSMNDDSYMDMLRDEEYSPEDRSRISVRGVAGCAIELGYLLFLLIAGCLFLTEGNGSAVSMLFAVLSFMFGITDAFYLIPCIRAAIEGSGERIIRLMRRGIYISCGAVSISHLLLLYIWRGLFPPITPFPLCAVVLWGASLFRAGAVALSGENRKDRRWILYRIVPLVVTGMFLIILFLLPAESTGSGYWKMSLAVLVSTGCSIPLEIWYGEVPGIGLFMIPKCISCTVMVLMGLLLFI